MHDLKKCDSDVEYHYESELDDNEVALAAETLETPLNTSDDEKGMSCMLEGDLYSPFTEQTWIGDSGLSCHLDTDDSGMYDVTSGTILPLLPLKR